MYVNNVNANFDVYCVTLLKCKHVWENNTSLTEVNHVL